MKKKAVEKSAVLQLLDLVFENANEAIGHSWERLNHAMSRALKLAIGSGFKFDVGDMKAVFEGYRSGYWIGESDEWIYALAIAVDNVSAYQSYEAAKDRKPFIADGVSRDRDHNGYTHGGSYGKQRERLAVGSSFPWDGKLVHVTSFAADQSYITAVTYKPSKDDEYAPKKIEKRYKITIADILAARKASKKKEPANERHGSNDQTQDQGATANQGGD